MLFMSLHTVGPADQTLTSLFFNAFVFVFFFSKNIMRGMRVNQDYSEMFINTNFFCVFLFCFIHTRVSINVYAYTEAAMQTSCMS